MGEEKITDPMERASVSGFSFVNAHPALWDKTVKIGAIVAGKLIKDGQLPFKVGLLNAWTQTRDLPTPSGESFRSWFKNKNK